MIKSILVSNNHLENLGGSETFTYTLIAELLEKGYEVEYYTFEKGLMSDKIEKDLGISFMSKKKYDVVFANHKSTVDHLKTTIKGKIIQTCHGIYPSLEQPHKYADGYISISNEVYNHLKSLGHESRIILNGIDCSRFFPQMPVSKTLSKVLSLSQSIEANEIIENACKRLGLEFNKLNKHVNPIWDVEKLINKVDLVIGLGRSAYEAMACGRAVIAYDQRSYSSSFADGYITKENISQSLLHNCSGRSFKLKFSEDDLVNELEKYNPENGAFLREFALENLNISKSTDVYLEYANKIKKNRYKDLRFKVKRFKKAVKKAFK